MSSNLSRITVIEKLETGGHGAPKKFGRQLVINGYKLINQSTKHMSVSAKKTGLFGKTVTLHLHARSGRVRDLCPIFGVHTIEVNGIWFERIKAYAIKSSAVIRGK